MISDAVITALIVAASSIICQVLINKGNRKKQTEEDAEKAKARAVEDAKREAHLEDRLKSIESKLDVHNGYAEKLGDIQTEKKKKKNDIKTLYKEIKP